MVVLVGELSGNGTNRAADGVHGSLLLGSTRNGLSVAVTSSGPARLANKDLVVVADTLQELNLAGNKVTSIFSSNVGVEEGLEVSRGKVDNTTESGARGLPDVERLSEGELTAVTSTLDGGLGGRNEAGEVRGRAESVRESLVVQGDELNTIPAVGLTPADNVADLAGTRADTAGVNVDTEDDLETETNGLGGDSLQLVAVGGVHADSIKAVGLDVLEFGQDVIGAHASTSVVGVASVGNGVVGMLTQSTARGAGGGAGRSRSGGGGGGSNWRRSDGGGRDRGNGSSGGRSGGSGSRSGRSGEGAHVGVGSLHNGHGLLRLGVGTRSHSGRGRVDNNGAGGDSGGDGSNGVSTGRGADVGGGLDDAGEGAANGADGGVGADHGGRGLDDSGHTTNGVSTTGEDGGSCLRNNGGGRHSDGGAWDGVGARSGEYSHCVGWERHSWSRGRCLDSHGAVASGQQSGSAGRGGGLWGRDGGDRDDCSVSTFLAISNLYDQLTSRSAPVGDNAGVATAGLLSLSTTTVEGSVLVVVTVFVSHGRAHEGGCGGQESSLHLRYWLYT